GGTGSIAGPVTVNDGGRVTPGDSFGTLTLSGSLTLATGSGIHFAIQHSPLTNSAIQVQGTFNENGALVVTNTGTTALAAGDHFQLITASARAGAFADVALPPLNSGLAWDTSTLNTTGDLTVVVSTPPVISSSFVAGNQFVLQASNGTPGRPVYVLTSTNLAAPLASWIPIATNEFNGAGNFAFTNTLDLQAEQNFYRLQTP
ncbi:MAG TPA: autotransporter outer membrane beta-barrel domain-containing protein, partial [Candidatus Binatia bacterium]|nr:autotransporter outer membrane beta-barrel domain-containing protein [Candidatus Binatia bacterium]